jgi:hypothetical protein
VSAGSRRDRERATCHEEDFAMCEAMHRNMRRGVVESVVIGRNEAAMIQLHEQVVALLRADVTG